MLATWRNVIQTLMREQLNVKWPGTLQCRPGKIQSRVEWSIVLLVQSIFEGKKSYFVQRRFKASRGARQGGCINANSGLRTSTRIIPHDALRHLT
jgi:hypothetical protein